MSDGSHGMILNACHTVHRKVRGDPVTTSQALERERISDEARSATKPLLGSESCRFASSSRPWRLT